MKTLALSLVCMLTMSMTTVSVLAQDGASYDAQAKRYKAPETSLAGAADTPERTAAIAFLFQGKFDEALESLKQLAEKGDVPA